MQSAWFAFHAPISRSDYSTVVAGSRGKRGWLFCQIGDASLRQDASLFAPVCEPRLFAPFSVAAGTRRGQRIGDLHHLVQVLGLRRFESLHSGISKLLNKSRPV